MQLFSFRNILLPLSIFLIICISFSNASIKEIKSCLESHGSNTASIFVVRTTNSERYDLMNYQWNNVSEIFPLAYILPQSTKDVQNAIRCGKACNVRIFPKCGGHSYEKYSFGDSRSIVLDLRNLSEIKINNRDKTAQIGAGALLSEVYLSLWTNGKYGIPSTSCTSVGIGGATLGGGYGFWSKRFGLTADNVIGMDFVDPQGNYLKVNRKSNADLFWALLGGGLGNFGVVTKFEFKLFDAAALRVKRVGFKYDVNLFDQIFAAFQSWNYDHRNGNAYIGMTVTQTDVSAKIIGTDLSDADVKSIIDKPAQMLKPVSIKSMNFMELTLENSTPGAKAPEDLQKVNQMSISKHGYRAKSYFSNKILSQKEILQLKPSLSTVPQGIFVQFGSFGGAVNRIPKNETSFVHRESLYLIQVGISPPDQPTKIELQKQQKWLREFENAAKILDQGESYQNYVDGELKDDFLQRYYGDNLSRLIAIKKRIDPDNYFAYEQSIPLRYP